MFSACSAVSSTLQGRPLRPFETRKHNFYAMFGLLLRADQETTKRAIIFGVRGVAGLARTASGDGEEPRGRDGLEKEVCGSATPKVVSAWSFDGGGGATTPLMLSHPLSRRSAVSICVYLYTLSFSIFLSRFSVFRAAR